MSSTAARHVDGNERRSSLKVPSIVSSLSDQLYTDSVKHDDEDEDNNQEETTEQSLELGTKASSRHVLDTAESGCRVHLTDTQATASRETILTTARLRLENAALKQQVKILQQRHETDAQALFDKLVSVTALHEQALGEVKAKLSCVESQTKDIASYRYELQQLTDRLHKMESSTSQEAMKDGLSVLPPPTPHVKPGLPVPLQRRGNGSPLPYNQPIRSVGPVKPFAWRDQVERARADQGAMSPPHTLQSPDAWNNNNQHCVHPVAEGHDSYSPICDSASYSPKPAHSATPKRAVLEKKPSGSLFSVCSGLITSKLSTPCESPVPAAPSPSMKVMPAWMVEERMQQRFQQVPPPTVAPGLSSHTAILIPDGIPTPSLAHVNEDSLLTMATSRIGEYLSQAVLPIHATSPS